MNRMERALAVCAVLLAVLGGAANSHAVDFGPATAYPAGTNPVGAITGDFNGDGKPDVAVLNAGSNNVSILLNNGDGTFQPAKDFDLGNSMSSIFIGDFNGDGKLDLALFRSGNSATADNGEVRILLGNGDGTFQAPVVTTLTPAAANLNVGDFDGDKRADLVVKNDDPSTSSVSIEVLLGKGDGAFHTPNPIAVPNMSGTASAVADLSGDGKLDIAVATSDGVLLLLGQGNGTFQQGSSLALAPGFTANTIWPVDFNGDGTLDLVVESRDVSCSNGEIHICTTAERLSVFLGTGHGNFGAEDLLVAASAGFHSTGILLGIAFGDFNGDGNLDVLDTGPTGSLPNLGPRSLQVRLARKDGTLALPIDFPNAGNILAAADLNGDHLADFMAVDPSTGNLNVYLNDSPSAGADLGIVSAASSPEPVGVGAALTYSATVLNEGPQDATGVTLTENLPASVTFVSATASQGSCSESNLAVTCVIGALADAADAQVAVSVTPNVVSTISNSLDVTGTQPDGALANNTLQLNSTVAAVYTLTLAKAGNGTGTVSTDRVGSVAGIDCGSVCSATYLSGSMVNVNANPDMGDFFSDWSGACSGSGGCAVIMDADKAVTADFVLGQALSVTLSGTGQGSVEDQGAHFFVCSNTNPDCGFVFFPGTSVSLVAIPSGTSVFGGWSGACTGTDPNTCTVTMSANETVTAAFNPPPDFSVSPSTASLSVARGTQATDVLTFPVQGGFSGMIALTCAVLGAPPAPTCMISPSSVTPGNSATLTISTAGLAAAFTRPQFGPVHNSYASAGCVSVAVFGLFFAIVFDEKRRARWSFCLAILVITLLPAACGSSASSEPQTRLFTVSVTATSGTIQHSTTVAITVK